MASKLVCTDNPENVKLTVEQLHTSLAIRDLEIFFKKFKKLTKRPILKIILDPIAGSYEKRDFD